MPPPAAATAPDGDIRDRILDAGARLFADHGYEAVSLRQICDEARVSKGAIYHYFLSKEELLSAIVVASLEQLAEHVENSARPGRSAAERLRGFIVSQAAFYERNTAGFRLATTRFAFELPAQPRIESLRRAYLRTIRQIFADGIATGEFRGIDTRAGTRMVLSLLYWLSRWYVYGRVSAVAIAEGHADIMLRGVSARER